MSSTPSVHLKRLLASLQPGPTWIDDVDLVALEQLTGAELTEATDALVALVGRRDPRAPRALAKIRASGTVPALRVALGRALDRFEVELAVALWQLTGEPGWFDRVREVLAGGGSDGRIRALTAFKMAPAQVCDVRGLVSALGDEVALVRQHAWLTMLHHIGIPFRTGSGAIPLTYVELSSQVPEEHTRGTRRALGLWQEWLEAARRGEHLNLHEDATDGFRTVVEASARAEEPDALDQVTQGYEGLNDVEKAWVERALVDTLGRAPNALLIEFLGHIGSILALPLLRSLVDDPDLGPASTAAIGQIEALEPPRE